MDEQREARGIQEVYDELRARFVELPPEYVEAAVRCERAALTGPIRDFVPLLVYRAANRRLRGLID